MALDQAANFVRETVTSAISAGDTTINVADASPFPVPPEGYNIVVWDGAAYVRPDQDPDVEIMRVTDTDTTNDTLTVARGQEGTSDVSHPDTSVVIVAQTAKMIADIASEKISNPVTETVNVDGNDVANVGALDAGDGTISGKPILGGADSGSSLSTQFGTWIQPSSANPSVVALRVQVVTDGTTSGAARLLIDENGDGIADINQVFANAHEGLGSGGIGSETAYVYIPSGGQIQVENNSDPSGGNAIKLNRAYIL